ncbi:MAG: HAD family hydrolase [Oscillospiraceae bacterium]|nr:HAD family hydrolase [Oscillospiraceae bacterium]
MKKYTHIIWDWNGTLLDDVGWCIACMNVMLKRRGLPILESVDAYHNVFGFPVKDYYSRVGFDFDKESFETLAVEYIELYDSDGSSASLFPDAKEILAEFHCGGIRQTVLSASELGNLLTQIKPFGIDIFFDEILGISDIYATGKIEIGKAYIERVKPEKAVLIGDTSHDKEAADALGIDCILVANGHQGKNTLMAVNAVIADCLLDIKDILL